MMHILRGAYLFFDFTVMICYSRYKIVVWKKSTEYYLWYSEYSKQLLSLTLAYSYFVRILFKEDILKTVRAAQSIKTNELELHFALTLQLFHFRFK